MKHNENASFDSSPQAVSAASWLSHITQAEIIPFLKEKGIAVPALKVLLSFPTSGGEAVEPPIKADGSVNPLAGEAKKRFQFLPALLTENGEMLEADRENADTMKLTKGGKVAADAPTLLITPAKQAPWSGSVFGQGETAEVAERVLAAIHGCLFASVVTNPPADAKRTKAGNVKVYGGHFEELAARIGLLGKGWAVNGNLQTFVKGILERNPAPEGAAITLNPPEKTTSSNIASVTLRTAQGTEFVISARATRSKKQEKEGKMSSLEFLRTQGPFTYVSDTFEDTQEGEGEEAAQ